MDFFYKLLDYIFPPSCIVCKSFGDGYLCNKCKKDLEIYLYNNTIEEQENKIFYLFQYRDFIRKKLIEYKFGEQSYLFHLFCEMFVKNKNACEFLKSYDIIIPVPIHKKRKNQRGYNQSELIAKELSNKTGITIYTDVLKKVRNTNPQSLLSKKERIKNVQSVYIVENSEKIRNRNVVILDDIYTTGATVNECKKILQQAGVKNIGTIIIAKD